MPLIAVLPVLSTVTLPPAPLPVASALMLAPAAICAVVAVRSPFTVWPPLARASVVPNATVPPCVCPDTSMDAPLAMVTALLATACTCPPVCPVAATAPSMLIEPPMASNTSVPPCPAALLASICPPAVTSVCNSPSAAAALSCTVPPLARMVPLLVTSAATGLPSGPLGTCITCPVTSMASSPSPYRSSV